MQDFEIHKKKFDSFLGKISENERVGILAHANCPDGMISTVFLIEILKKKFPQMADPYVGFIPYKIGILDEYAGIFNREGIKKIFILDANIDMNQLEETERFFDKFEVMFIDHHPLNPKLKLDDKVIKTISDDCTSIVIYHLGKESLNNGRWTELACVAAVSEFSYKNEDNLKFIQKHYEFNPKDYQNSEIFKKTLRLNSIVTYYSKDSFKAYELILKRNEEKIDQIHKEVSEEFDRCIFDFDKNAERHFNGQLVFYFFKSKFSIGSTIGTAVSVRNKGSTIIIFSEIEGTDLLKVSTRNNAEDLVYPMNEMLRYAIKDFNSALGGGHANASGGSFLKKDLETFKKNIIEYVKNKLNA